MLWKFDILRNLPIQISIVVPLVDLDVGMIWDHSGMWIKFETETKEKWKNSRVLLESGTDNHGQKRIFAMKIVGFNVFKSIYFDDFISLKNMFKESSILRTI